MTCRRVPHCSTLGVFVLLAVVPSVLFTLTTSRAIASDAPLFLPAVTYDSGGVGGNSLAVADVNGDGIPDLIVSNTHSYACVENCFDGSVGVLLGKGDGTFQTAAIYSSGGTNAAAVVVADVNGDGKPDLLVANNGGAESKIGVLLGNGDGTFQPPIAYGSGGAFARRLVVADVNGDHHPDLIVANLFSNTIGVLLGNGDGTFKAAVTYDSGKLGLASVEVADVNGDGKPDLVVANCGAIIVDCPPDQVVHGSVGILLGNGDGTFAPATVYDSGGSAARQVAVADLNVDGKADLLVENEGCCFISLFLESSSVGVLLGNGDGSFQPSVAYRTGGRFATMMALADVNADGKVDILVPHPIGLAFAGDASVGVLLGNGDGTFQSHANYFSRGAGSVTVADVNGDGKADFVVADIGGIDLIELALGNGDGTFQASTAYDPGGQALSPVVVTDLNGDGQQDLVVAETSHDPQLGGLVGVLLHKDTIPPVVTVFASPKVLWPPNGSLVPVTVSGTITDKGSGVKAATAAYAVEDEYGKVQPSGAITLGAGGTYAFTILLQASRRGSDFNGRQYKITVRASDNAGNLGSRAAVVTVLHSRSVM